MAEILDNGDFDDTIVIFSENCPYTSKAKKKKIVTFFEVQSESLSCNYSHYTTTFSISRLSGYACGIEKNLPRSEGKG